MLLFYVSAAASLVLSLLFKFIGDAYFGERIEILGDWLALQLTFNPGIAFGLQFSSALQTPLILCALAFMCYLAYVSERTRVNLVGFGCIVGGAFGNVLDRLPDGLVTDFVRVGSFPVFNVADSFITVGVLLLLLGSLPPFRRVSGQAPLSK